MNRFLGFFLALFIALQVQAAGRTEFIDATSMGASINGATLLLNDKVSGYSIEAIVSAATSPVGSFKLQVSNLATPASGDWVDVPGSDQSVSAAGDFFWNVVDPKYDKLRLVYTRTSGTATCDATILTRESK
jgi:hypothetical protein